MVKTLMMSLIIGMELLHNIYRLAYIKKNFLFYLSGMLHKIVFGRFSSLLSGAYLLIYYKSMH